MPCCPFLRLPLLSVIVLCSLSTVIMPRCNALEKHKKRLQFGEYLRVHGIQARALPERDISGRSNQRIQKEKVT